MEKRQPLVSPSGPLSLSIRGAAFALIDSVNEELRWLETWGAHFTRKLLGTLV